MTVSASIPVAVLSITLFRAFSKAFGIRRATILENNIVQTTGSAGEGIAFGAGVTMPAMLILGYDLNYLHTALVAVLGGILGTFLMIPIRRAHIVKEHKALRYPEGTACAEVLISGREGRDHRQDRLRRAGVRLAVRARLPGASCSGRTRPERVFGKWYDGGNISAEVDPALLGVGYVIGTRTSLIMGAGGILASLVLMPAIKLFGSTASAPIYPATVLIKDMSTHDIWHDYVLYIGAGAVAAGGIISLVRAIPTIVGGAVRGHLRPARRRRRDSRPAPTGTCRSGSGAAARCWWSSR